MNILVLRTDKPEAELHVYNDEICKQTVVWHAHRQLAETIHTKIKHMLEQTGLQLSDIEGIVVYKGPGSFTGLRIGMTVANALAYSLNVPIVATTGSDWIEQGIEAAQTAPKRRYVVPEYGGGPHITQQKK